MVPGLKAGASDSPDLMYLIRDAVIASSRRFAPSFSSGENQEEAKGFQPPIGNDPPRDFVFTNLSNSTANVFFR